MNLAVFDLCGTLYPHNSLFELAKAVSPRRAFWLGSLVFKGLDRLLRPLGLHPRRALALSMLRGRTRAELDEAAARVVARLQADFRPETMVLLSRYRRAGYTLVLASAAPECMVKAVARALLIDMYICAELEYADDRATGRLAQDPTGKKLALLRPLRYRELAVVTDNRSDLALVRRATLRHIVTRNKRDARWWSERALIESELIRPASLSLL